MPTPVVTLKNIERPEHFDPSWDFGDTGTSKKVYRPFMEIKGDRIHLTFVMVSHNGRKPYAYQAYTSHHSPFKRWGCDQTLNTFGLDFDGCVPLTQEVWGLILNGPLKVWEGKWMTTPQEILRRSRIDYNYILGKTYVRQWPGCLEVVKHFQTNGTLKAIEVHQTPNTLKHAELMLMRWDTEEVSNEESQGLKRELQAKVKEGAEGDDLLQVIDKILERRRRKGGDTTYSVEEMEAAGIKVQKPKPRKPRKAL